MRTVYVYTYKSDGKVYNQIVFEWETGKHFFPMTVDGKLESEKYFRDCLRYARRHKLLDKTVDLILDLL